ncbi:hypothetical protein RJT34_25749 [Clitoria ternatea]|uniref:Mitochondrial inner membrane protease ATP23 n=1 Tax=Clitoria ternatea TaxID=43366 RepID=A0AAN9FQI7_CLITE
MTEDNLTFSDFPSKSLQNCQRIIRKALLSPQVRFLRERLEKSGCSTGDSFIKAVNCHEEGAVAAGYFQGQGVLLFSSAYSIY